MAVEDSHPLLLENISLGKSLFVHHISTPFPSFGLPSNPSLLSSFGIASSISLAPILSTPLDLRTSLKTVYSLSFPIVASQSSCSNSLESAGVKRVLRNITIVRGDGRQVECGLGPNILGPLVPRSIKGRGRKSNFSKAQVKAKLDVATRK